MENKSQYTDNEVRETVARAYHLGNDQARILLGNTESSLEDATRSIREFEMRVPENVRKGGSFSVASDIINLREALKKKYSPTSKQRWV